VSLGERERHLFRVSMTVPDVREELVLQLPAWNALYQIRDFAYRVREVSAHPDLGGLGAAVVKQDKLTWRVVPFDRAQGNLSESRRLGGAVPPARLGTVRVDYAAYWDDPGPFSAQLNSTHAFINFALLLFYVPERRGEAVEVELRDVPPGWKAATALKQGATSASFRAPSYDELADAPVEVSDFDEATFEVAGARIRVVVHGPRSDRAEVYDAVRRIVTYQTQLMRETPFEEYVFLYHFSDAGGGGMEHANSTAIDVPAGSSASGVTAHEFFHLWNVKRIRPQGLEPVDYTRENATRALWFAEGVTSTYGAYTLVRTGLWNRERFYEELADQIAQLESRPARHWQSVEQASLEAWYEKYPLYRGPEFSISYYNKGEILGVLLDILIRDSTDNRASLDDVLRYLDREFAHRHRYYNDSADIRAAAEKIAGADFGEFFARFVAGTDELPCVEILGRAGLLLAREEILRADFGFFARRAAGAPESGAQMVVEGLEAGGAAEAAGLRPGDGLLELNGRAFPANPERWLRAHRAGETVRLRVRRNAEEREVSFALGERREPGYAIRQMEKAGEKQRRIREGLLRGATDPER
jgi:predicted metalloprotease with PDZ domain